MSSRWVFLLCASAPAIAGACAGLKAADPNPMNVPDGGSGSADANDDDDVVEPPDAGTPPDDFDCGGDFWNHPTKTNPGCASRQVRVVFSKGAYLNNGVSIARTPAGRIGIAFNDNDDADTGRLRVVHFVPNQPDFAAPAEASPTSSALEHVGHLSRIRAEAPDTFHVLSFDFSAASSLGTLNVQKLVDGNAALTAPEPVATDIAYPTEIGFAVSEGGTHYAFARTQVTDDTSKLLGYTRAPGSSWSPLPELSDLGRGLRPKEGPGIGTSSLVVDRTDRLHLLYHHNEGRFASTPRYHVLTGTEWSYRKTVSNHVFDGWAGYSGALAIFGTRKYALYYFHKGDQYEGTATAELRLASWVSPDETPMVEVLDQNISSISALHPRYAAAMAIDKYGLVHIAAVRPSPSESKGYLEYRRQQRLEGGGIRWLSDIIDDDVLSFETPARVDLVVDDDARPHIAYLSGKDWNVRYATRYDR